MKWSYNFTWAERISLMGCLVIFAGFFYLDRLLVSECKKLELLAQDEQTSVYLLSWANSLANDQDYLNSLREYPTSGPGRSLRDHKYTHSSIAEFDWKGLGLTHANIPHSMTLTDLDGDGTIDIVWFPSGRDRLGVILDTKFKLEDFVSPDFLDDYSRINSNFFVFCDDGSY